jgi:chromosome partitioning protein
MPAKTITIATHKGGTGKTVTAMALGAGLARAGKQTLLVDLDPQAHSTIGLGLDLANTDPTLRDVFSEPSAPLSKIIRDTHLEFLKVAPSHIRLERITQSLYARPKREELLKRALRDVQARYDFIVIDCPPSLGVLTETGIAAADLVLIPSQMEARAADGIVDLLELIAILKGDGWSDWRILLTKVDSRKSVTNEAVMAALSRWQAKILKTPIPQSEPLNQAQIERTDIYTYDPDSKGAVAYKALTEEILNYGS